MKPVKRRAAFSRAHARLLNVDAVCYFAAVEHLKFLQGVPVKRKKALFEAIRKMPGPNLEPLDLEPGLLLDLPMIAGPKVTAAHACLADRKRCVTTDPEIFGGVPTVKGTRIPVYAIHGQLADGDTIDDLLEDHPEIPREAFVTADIYARTHPERGRPVVAGRPWEAAA
ncbi:MAG: DUF433 domain-containing protein [Boseongicola sp.]|nr:DUF433 domain-containing protein [Boseongicola sp.]